MSNFGGKSHFEGIGMIGLSRLMIPAAPVNRQIQFNTQNLLIELSL